MPEKFLKHYININVHAVNGDAEAIEYFRNADTHFVEGLFFFAKRYGRTEFNYKGHDYELLKNRNLTYTVQRKPDEVEALAKAFE